MLPSLCGAIAALPEALSAQPWSPLAISLSARGAPSGSLCSHSALRLLLTCSHGAAWARGGRSRGLGVRYRGMPAAPFQTALPTRPAPDTGVQVHAHEVHTCTHARMHAHMGEGVRT